MQKRFAIINLFLCMMVFSSLALAMEFLVSDVKQPWQYYEVTLKSLTVDNAYDHDIFLEDLIYKPCNFYKSSESETPEYETYFEILLSNYDFATVKKVIQYCESAGSEIDFTKFITRMNTAHPRLKMIYKSIEADVLGYQDRKTLRV